MAIFKKKVQSIPLRTPEAIAKEDAEREAEKVRILEASLDFVRLEKHKAEQEEKARLQAAQKEAREKTALQSEASAAKPESIQAEENILKQIKQDQESRANEHASGQIMQEQVLPGMEQVAKQEESVPQKLPPNFHQKPSVNSNPLYGGVQTQPTGSEDEKPDFATAEKDRIMPESEDSQAEKTESEKPESEDSQAEKTESEKSESEKPDSLQSKAEDGNIALNPAQTLSAKPDNDNSLHTATATGPAVDRRKLYGRRMDYKTAVVSKKSDANADTTEAQKGVSQPNSEYVAQKVQHFAEVQKKMQSADTENKIQAARNKVVSEHAKPHETGVVAEKPLQTMETATPEQAKNPVSAENQIPTDMGISDNTINPEVMENADISEITKNPENTETGENAVSSENPGNTETGKNADSSENSATTKQPDDSKESEHVDEPSEHRKEENKKESIPNPLPVPKKHVAKMMNYDLEPSEEDMHFDLVDMTGIEYFDIN